MQGRTIHRFVQNRQGVSAVEFALVFPVFLTMLFGIFVVGMTIATAHSLQHAVQEAARAAVAGLSDDERDDLARKRIAAIVAEGGLLQREPLTMTSGSSATDTSLWTVTLTYDLRGTQMWSLAMRLGIPIPPLVRSASTRNGGLS